MIVQDKVILNRGGNMRLNCQWTETTAGVTSPVPLTGVTFTPFEVEPAALATGMTFTITDGVNGRFRVDRAWNSDWPDGTGAIVSFRAQSNDGLHTIPKIQVTLK